MKMRKLLSIGALTLAVVSCTSIGASATEVAGQDKKSAIEAMVKKGLDGGNPFNAVSINANTRIEKYLTTDFINEINKELKDKNLNKYIEENGKETPWKVEPTDRYYDVQRNIAKTIKSLDEGKRKEALDNIKNFLQTKLKDFEEASLKSDEELEYEVKKYLIVPSGSKLTVGRNSDSLRVVSLEKGGKIIAQINSGNVYKAKQKLDSVETYEELKDLILTYYPGAEEEYKEILGKK